MQPYQKASEKIRSSGEMPVNLAKNLAIGAATGGIARAGASAMSKLLPAVSSLINKYVPDNLMEKGLEKLDPRFKTFINGVKKDGYTSDDIRKYMGDKVEEAGSQQEEQAKQKGNIIEQESPELNQFILNMIKKGHHPTNAGVQAALGKEHKFKNAINNLEKKHKTSWGDIVSSIYGTGEQALPEDQQQQSGNPGQMGQQGQQQGGQGQQAIMQALQMAAESRKRRQK
jgi:hypothetical protein